jgi:hypothetical protein
MNTARTALAASLIALLAIAPATADAQLGRQQGLVEPNVAADSTVAALPHLTTACGADLRQGFPLPHPPRRPCNRPLPPLKRRTGC